MIKEILFGVFLAAVVTIIVITIDQNNKKVDSLERIEYSCSLHAKSMMRFNGNKVFIDIDDANRPDLQSERYLEACFQAFKICTEAGEDCSDEFQNKILVLAEKQNEK